MHKYGREFSLAVMENRDGCVSDRVRHLSLKLHTPERTPCPTVTDPFMVGKVVRKLGVDTPSADLVDAYLVEIAKGYSVEWVPPGNNEHNAGPDGGVKVSHSLQRVRP